MGFSEDWIEYWHDIITNQPKFKILAPEISGGSKTITANVVRTSVTSWHYSAEDNSPDAYTTTEIQLLVRELDTTNDVIFIRITTSVSKASGQTLRIRLTVNVTA